MEMHSRIIEKARIRATDAESRTVEFIASDNSVDSYGTVLPVDKWNLDRYAKNPIIGYQHNLYGERGSDPDDIIGKGEAFVEDGQLIVKVSFEPKEINEKAEKIYRKVLFGTLNGVSVGFAPTAEGRYGDEKKGEDPDVYYFGGQELLEVSVVNIPANANAVRRSIDDMRRLLPVRECGPKDEEEKEKALGEEDEEDKEKPDSPEEEENPVAKKKKKNREDDKPEEEKDPIEVESAEEEKEKEKEEDKPEDEDGNPDKAPVAVDKSYLLTSARAHLAINTSKLS